MLLQSIKTELEERDVKERADLLRDVIKAFYDFEKFDRPGGEGLDGRDGEARRGVGKVLDAAELYWDESRLFS